LTLLSPGALAIVFVVCALWVWLSPRSLAARRTTLAAAVFYFLASVYIVPAAIASITLAAHAEPLNARAAAATPTAIVLLGAGNEHVQGGGAAAVSVMSLVEAARVLEAARVFDLVHADWIISSGGPLRDENASAVVMRDALVQLGVPAKQIVLESSSHDTHDEAVLIAPMLKSLHVQRTILVTSAIHMPRSLGTFRAVGVEAIPAPVREPGASLPRLRRWSPTTPGLLFSSQLAHEFIGLAYYRARGWWIS
jgi:uncharacterized SAM-binding protein YcdF (DUF218 family)